MSKLRQAIKNTNPETIDLPEINNLLKDAITMKIMQMKPITYWTKELAVLVKTRNKIRYTITKNNKKIYQLSN